MICSKCQLEYDNSINPQCPNCNSTNISISFVETIKVDVSISYKGRSNEKVNKKPLFEFKGGNEINRTLNRKVDRSYHIDRVQNRYTETVKDSITGELIHSVDEQLTDHINHGDAKKKKRGRIMIKFTDFIRIDFPDKTKIKFNMNAGDWNKRAWDLLLDDSDDWFQMNEWKTKQPNNNLNHAKYLIAMAQYYPYGPEYFIFGGIYKVEKRLPEVFDARGYKLIPTGLYAEYEKRLIIKINKPIGRDLYNRWFSSIDSMEAEVYELAPRTKLGHFLGYQNVSINHEDMMRIINNNEPSWKQALSNIKGIYAITDKETGKIYIGSASGNTDGIWQRWSSYANTDNLTGGNKAFEEIKGKFGGEYIKKHFKYSIIEIFDTKTKQEIILDREQYWMRVFETKTYGLNY